MRTFNQLKIYFLTLLTVTFFNCNDDDSSSIEEQGTSKISVRLADNPGDYDNVFVDVIDVMVKVNDDSTGENGWQSAGPINAGIYDLLELTGGLSVLLVNEFEVPSGTLNQIRLVLGEDNTIVIDGETFPLNTPSAQQSGLKININEQLFPGYTYDILLDFNVDQSIVIAGNSGNINLKPVITASTQYTSGSIQGAVTPFDFQIMASVEVGGELISAYTDDSGVFLIHGVSEGTYSVTITPDPTSGYGPTTVDNIQVVNGQTTDIGLIELQMLPQVGAITGTVLNPDVMATASIDVNGTMVSADTNDLGVFILEDIPVGIYTVTITPDPASGLSATEFLDVEVVQNTTVDLGDITLN
ncbi:DUF4382 domain-containing protein [Formosa maritima]|uniref:DUF4382 domain-containing protein n=1 Tax=Formosa maritima TaxID=2592046 RepID=A0A5D0GMB3_9FLAO|nr:DUF4382 domain-containing protein [Formosa maritima]TYA60178.1 DUF4382 domain-containing protein [Formosa maritima]